MRILVTAFAGLLTVGTAALCEPQRATPQAAQLPHRSGDVLLASAEVQSAAAPTVEATPARHRIVRVTKCRCGDPQPPSETPED
jgi:hypothetical protein